MYIYIVLYRYDSDKIRNDHIDRRIDHTDRGNFK